MWFSKQLKRMFRPLRKPARARLSIEPLEDRTVPALMAPVSYPDPLAVANVGDFNNDGIADLVGVGKDTLAGLVVVRLANGDGSLQQPLTSAAVDGARRIDAGDFNADGKLDLVMGYNNGNNNHVRLQLGNGNGTFQSPTVIFSGPTEFGPLAYGIGDLNGDQLLDLAAATLSISGWSTATSRLNVRLGNGDGTFVAAPPSYTKFVIGLFLGDFNEDGAVDVLSRNVNSLFGGGNSTRLQLGNGDGTFQTPVTVSSNNGAQVVADFDSDGHLDFATWSTYLGNGDGTFQQGPSPAVGEVFPESL